MTVVTETGTPRPTPIRSLLEIGALAAYLVLVPPLFEAAMARFGLAAEGVTQVIGTSILYVGFAFLAVALVKAKGQTLAELGFRRPRSINAAIWSGLAVAVFFFALVEVLRRTGLMTGSWASAADWRGNIGLLLAWVGMITLLTGFIEEFIYRGFVMDRIASAFGRTRFGWGVALIGQAILFGLAHAYGNLELILFAGAFSIAYGLMYLYGGRNLWGPIIAHASYDIARAVYFYYNATYGGAHPQ